MSIRHAESVAQELELLSKYTRAFLKQFTSMRDYELVQLINKATTIYNVLRDYERYVKRVMRF
ncbi:MAG: hypothetical protein ACO2OR_00850 [Desulfurococcaceae archaeon]